VRFSRRYNEATIAARFRLPFEIETKIGLPCRCVGAVAGKARVGKNRPYVAGEVDLDCFSTDY
jgi:hypothetical protein